jgi:hypothetical protein
MEETLQKLYETAAALALNSAPPVQLPEICDQFGIRIRRDSEKRRSLKHAFLFQADQIVEIVLPEGIAKSSEFTAWERFLIAHELGHFFLSRLKAPKPFGAREYWSTERACDRFARQLLLPFREVSQTVMVAGESATDLLSATLHLQTKWSVPWPVAAHEVAGFARTVHFFRLQSKGGRIRVSASTMPNKGGTGSIIPEMSSLGALLRDLPPNGNRPKRMPIERCGGIRILASATDVAVYRVGLSEYRMASRSAQ